MKLIPYHLRIQEQSLTYEAVHFRSDQFVSYIIECSKLFWDKCIHQSTRHGYVKLSSKFEILKIEEHYDNTEICTTQ